MLNVCGKNVLREEHSCVYTYFFLYIYTRCVTVFIYSKSVCKYVKIKKRKKGRKEGRSEENIFRAGPAANGLIVNKQGLGMSRREAGTAEVTLENIR